MIWIAPSEKDHDNDALEKRLWAAADQLRANSGLTSQQYSALGEKYPPWTTIAALHARNDQFLGLECIYGSGR